MFDNLFDNLKKLDQYHHHSQKGNVASAKKRKEHSSSYDSSCSLEYESDASMPPKKKNSKQPPAKVAKVPAKKQRRSPRSESTEPADVGIDPAQVKQLLAELQQYKSKNEKLEAELKSKGGKVKVKNLQCPFMVDMIRDIFKNHMWHEVKFLQRKEHVKRCCELFME